MTRNGSLAPPQSIRRRHHTVLSLPPPLRGPRRAKLALKVGVRGCLRGYRPLIRLRFAKAPSPARGEGKRLRINSSWPQPPSFRGDAKHRTRNLEIPGLVLTHHPGTTAAPSIRLRHPRRG